MGDNGKENGNYCSIIGYILKESASKDATPALKGCCAAWLLWYWAQVCEAATSWHMKPQRPLRFQGTSRQPGHHRRGSLREITLNGSPESRGAFTGLLLPILSIEIYAGHTQVGCFHSRGPCQAPQASGSTISQSHCATAQRSLPSLRTCVFWIVSIFVCHLRWLGATLV